MIKEGACMVVRPNYYAGNPHGRLNVDPTVTFEAGQIGQLTVDPMGNTVVTLAGSKPLGLIDDNKTTAFTQPIIGEVHYVATVAAATWYTDNAHLVSDSELVFLLSSTGAVAATCVRGVDYSVTSYANGIFAVFLAGLIDVAVPYLDMNHDGVADSVNIAMQYHFAVPGVAGQDTTLASGLVTMWFHKGEYSVSMYDSAASYAVNTKLYVGDGAGGHAPLGVLTVAARTANTQVVGIVTQPPTASNPLLTTILDFDFGSWV